MVQLRVHVIRCRDIENNRIRTQFESDSSLILSDKKFFDSEFDFKKIVPNPVKIRFRTR